VISKLHLLDFQLLDLDPDLHWDLGLDTQLENMLDPDPH
jgi:hypothetical protein